MNAINRRQTVQGLAGGALALAALRGRARAADTKVVRVGYQKFGLLVTLKARGTFDRALAAQGVNVEWSEFPGGIQLVEALGAGKLDLGVVGEGPPVFAQAAGAPVVYLGAEPPAPEGVAILIPKDSPIKTVADLRGKHVVVNKGSNSHYLLLKALEEAKLPYKDIKVSFVPPAAARAAFESKQVDAWSIWDPFQASVEEASGARVLRDGRGLVQNPGYYIGTRPFADANPQLVRLFLDQIEATGAWANQNRPKVVALLAPLLGIKELALDKALGRNRYGVEPVDDQLFAAQQRVADAFAAEKLIPRPIRVLEARWKSPHA